MYLLVAAFALVVLLGAVLLIRVGRSCGTSRSVLVHVPIAAAWEMVRDFGALHAAHGRGRPILRIDTSAIRQGDGHSPGTVWRQVGRWEDRPWWAEIEMVALEAPRRIEVRLLRDSFGTQAGLARHRCAIELREEGPGATKLTLRLSARMRGLRLALLRAISPERLRARLLDLGLRSLKVAFDARAPIEAEAGAATPAPSSLRGPAARPASPAPAVAPPRGTRVDDRA